jgi:hypothetical protein
MISTSHTPRGDTSTNPPSPSDVADFHLRWNDFRPHAVAALSQPDLTPVQRETLTWLIALSDRISSRDLGA